MGACACPPGAQENYTSNESPARELPDGTKFFCAPGGERGFFHKSSSLVKYAAVLSIFSTQWPINGPATPRSRPREAAYRAAITADPRDANAHYNLGLLLENERKDFDGAEAAYRAAIAADPGHAHAHINLGLLLRTRAVRLERSGGDLSEVAALYDEVARLLGVSDGVESDVSKAALANAARARAGEPPPTSDYLLGTGWRSSLREKVGDAACMRGRVGRRSGHSVVQPV